MTAESPQKPEIQTYQNTDGQYNPNSSWTRRQFPSSQNWGRG